MEIKEQDSQRMLLTPTLWEQQWRILILAFAIVLAFFVPSVFIAISVAWGLYILGELISHKVVIDKLTESIIEKKRHFLLIHRSRIIPFSAVYVAVDYAPKVTSSEGITESYDEWEISINIGGEKMKIAHGSSELDMLYLADAICRLMGKELLDNSTKPESPFGQLFRRRQ